MNENGNISDFQKFELMAMPHSWFLKASELYAQSELLFNQKGHSIVVRTGDNDTQSKDQANGSAFLLAGFALENLIKAFLVYEHPDWIKNGKLSNNLTKGHSLTKLAKKSTLLPWPIKGRPILEAMESGLNSWTRYPCPLNYSMVSSERYFTDELWAIYQLQMERYFKEICRLLSKNWKGPHSFEGYFSITYGFWSSS